MNRRMFLKAAGLAAVAPAFAKSGAAVSQRLNPSYSHPNIVFILADDFGWGNVGCYANDGKKSITPNIDRLAENGIRMTDAHSQSICSPTRYSLLTGEYPWRSWLDFAVLFPFEPPLIAKDRPTLPSLLKNYGYDTACIGKWHLGWTWRGVDGEKFIDVDENGVPSYYPRTSISLRNKLLSKGSEIDYTAPIEDGPITKGFDYYFGEGVINQPPFAWIENDRFVEEPVMHWNTDSKKAVEPLRWNYSKYPRPSGHASVKDWSPWDVQPVQTQKVVEYIESKTRSKKPYFLYMPMTAVHSPIVPAKEFQGKTESKYKDFIYQMDWTVGQVVETLEKTGQIDNTLVVFMSDNGAPTWTWGTNGSWRGAKGSIYEGGHRVPTVVSWAGKFKKDAVNDSLFCVTDFYRTIAGLLDIPVPDNAARDSFDCSKALLNPEDSSSARPGTVHRSGNPLFAIRKGDWKLVIQSNFKAGVTDNTSKFQLYNLKTDPAEESNVVKKYPKVVKELHKLMKEISTRPEREVFKNVLKGDAKGDTPYN